MNNAEEIHYKAVMAADNQEPPKDYCISAHADHFNGFVEGFIKGYHQAEKDLELSWEDMRELHIIFVEIDVDIELCKTGIKAETLGYYQEVLKRFLKERKEK